MAPIIKVQGIGKRYRVGETPPYRTLRESITSAAGAPLRAVRGLMRANRGSAGTSNEIWAVRDVSFDVNPGEVLGIIGRNGAGKSTLLKILSRITQPTVGRAELHGRVGSLLEVGTGFHPELTGRENAYLSGTILGMRRAEITRKFDAIVDFAGVEKFIDTPVKHYSSGMYVRLAFAVAAHLETEILLVDEVLAVGDAAFQKKCLGKMSDVAREGRTILFVSHNMAAVESLCGSCVLLSGGGLEAAGSAAEMVSRYMAVDVQKEGARPLVDHPGRTRGSIPKMKSITLTSASDSAGSVVRMDSWFQVAIDFESRDRPLSPVIGLLVRNSHGAAVFGVNNRFIAGYRFPDRLTHGTVCCKIERVPLMPGIYSIDLYFGDPYEDFDAVFGAITFEVVPSDVFGTGQLPPAGTGSVFWPASFELRGSDQETGEIQ